MSIGIESFGVWGGSAIYLETVVGADGSWVLSGVDLGAEADYQICVEAYYVVGNRSAVADTLTTNFVVLWGGTGR